MNLQINLWLNICFSFWLFRHPYFLSSSYSCYIFNRHSNGITFYGLSLLLLYARDSRRLHTKIKSDILSSSNQWVRIKIWWIYDLGKFKNIFKSMLKIDVRYIFNQFDELRYYTHLYCMINSVNLIKFRRFIHLAISVVKPSFYCGKSSWKKVVWWLKMLSTTRMYLLGVKN